MYGGLKRMNVVECKVRKWLICMQSWAAY